MGATGGEQKHEQNQTRSEEDKQTEEEE